MSASSGVSPRFRAISSAPLAERVVSMAVTSGARDRVIHAKVADTDTSAAITKPRAATPSFSFRWGSCA